MNTTENRHKNLELHNIEKMHLESKKLLLELRFIKDEQPFFEELLETYSFQLIVDKKFSANRKLISELNGLQLKNTEFIKNLIDHENKLELLVQNNGKTQSEVNYVIWHKNIIKDTEIHLDNFRLIKTQIFDLMKSIMRKEKQKYLINK